MGESIHVCGDVGEILSGFDDEYFDACFCDPPYGLKFMGKEWDHGVPSSGVWAEILRCLKPGGMMLAFGGTRTHHRLMVAIEDAGFQIRDCLMWIYGSGFPKSHDLSKAIDKAAGVEFSAKPASGVGFMNPDGAGGYNVTHNQLERAGETTPAAQLWTGYGTALKPAWEPVVLAMKPIDGTFAHNALEHGVAGLNIDGSRIASSDPIASHFGTGRWPANLLLDEDSARLVDEQSGVSSSIKRTGKRTGKRAGVLGAFIGQETVIMGHDDSGGASRFFYCAKVNPSERNKGVDGKNTHPTLKPLKLTEYLANLLLPPERQDEPRCVMVPFSGAGSEMIGALKAGWDEVIGIELDDDYITISEARIAAHMEEE